MTTKELGDLGEKLACEYLVGKGYKILGKNYRITFGEIDIIAKKDKVLHFIEVKALANSSFTEKTGFFPEQHVDYKKQRKLRQMSQIWLNKNNYSQETAYQIDIISVLANQTASSSPIMDGLIYRKPIYHRPNTYLYSVPYAIEALEASREP